MKNKKFKNFLLAVFLLISVLIIISVFSLNKNESLSLSKNVDQFNLITHTNEKFDNAFFSNYPSLIFFGFTFVYI